MNVPPGGVVDFYDYATTFLGLTPSGLNTFSLGGGITFGVTY